MAEDIFEFWARLKKGEKIHPADRDVFRRIDPKRHGFQLQCLPGSFGGCLRMAPIVLLYLSPGFAEEDVRDALTKAGRDYNFRKLSGDIPLRDDATYPGTKWVRKRTKHFGDWETVRRKIAVLNIGGYHSKTLNDFSVLTSLPSSRVSLEWAQTVLFPEAEAGKRVVICMRSAPYWGLEQGCQYGLGLFAPFVNRAGYLIRNKTNAELIDIARRKLGLAALTKLERLSFLRH